MLNLPISQDKKNELNGAFKGGLKSTISLCISSIPVLNIAFAMHEGLHTARLHNLIQSIEKRVSSIEEKKLDKSYIESEEFYDLFLQSMNIYVEHRSKLKAKYIESSLVESIQTSRDSRFETEIKEIFLHLLSEISDQELIFLYDFLKGKYDKRSKEHVYKNCEESVQISLDILYTKGLIKNEETWANYIQLTPFGKKFIEYIKILNL